jgi:hypothetical protein
VDPLNSRLERGDSYTRHGAASTGGMAESPDFRTLSSKENPQLYILNMAKKLRGGGIFLDYLRNGRMATAVRHCRHASVWRDSVHATDLGMDRASTSHQEQGLGRLLRLRAAARAGRIRSVRHDARNPSRVQVVGSDCRYRIVRALY